MSRYHINPATGATGPCSATTGLCPFGGAEDHFSTPEDARRTYEHVMERQQAWASVRRTTLQDPVFIRHVRSEILALEANYEAKVRSDEAELVSPSQAAATALLLRRRNELALLLQLSEKMGPAPEEAYRLQQHRLRTAARELEERATPRLHLLLGRQGQTLPLRCLREEVQLVGERLAEACRLYGLAAEREDADVVARKVAGHTRDLVRLDMIVAGRELRSHKANRPLLPAARDRWERQLQRLTEALRNLQAQVQTLDRHHQKLSQQA